MITFNENLMGKMIIAQKGKEFEIEIRQGNCLAVFISSDSENHYLYNFFCDEAHLKRFIKEYKKPFLDEVKSIRLNLKYKECLTLVKHFTKCGYEVTCYQD